VLSTNDLSRRTPRLGIQCLYVFFRLTILHSHLVKSADVVQIKCVQLSVYLQRRNIHAEFQIRYFALNYLGHEFNKTAFLPVQKNESRTNLRNTWKEPSFPQIIMNYNG
jgi:hypothetical protein